MFELKRKVKGRTYVKEQLNLSAQELLACGATVFTICVSKRVQTRRCRRHATSDRLRVPPPVQPGAPVAIVNPIKGLCLQRNTFKQHATVTPVSNEAMAPWLT